MPIMKAVGEGEKAAGRVVIFEARSKELEDAVLDELGKLVGPTELSPEDARWVSGMEKIMNYGSNNVEGLSRFKAENPGSTYRGLALIIERDSKNPSYVGARIRVVDKGKWTIGGRLVWNDDSLFPFFQGAVDALKWKLKDRFGYSPNIFVEMVR